MNFTRNTLSGEVRVSTRKRPLSLDGLVRKQANPSCKSHEIKLLHEHAKSNRPGAKQNYESYEGRLSNNDGYFSIAQVAFSVSHGF